MKVWDDYFERVVRDEQRRDMGRWIEVERTLREEEARQHTRSLGAQLRRAFGRSLVRLGSALADPDERTQASLDHTSARRCAC